MFLETVILYKNLLLFLKHESIIEYNLISYTVKYESQSSLTIHTQIRILKC